MLSVIFMIVCGLLVWNLLRFFIVCLYMFCRWRFSYQEGRVGIPLADLTLPHLWVCTKPGAGISNFIYRSIFEFRWEVIIHSIDIGGIDDHHCLNFLFINQDLEIHIVKKFPFLIIYQMYNFDSLCLVHNRPHDLHMYKIEFSYNNAVSFRIQIYFYFFITDS